ncbi:DUF3857 domain-containing protein [Flavobacterium sp.]|jgi:hypothetical protein|uniref:DUF3857 domain-containing protein n=1 Tax=Flavobacterium sp. TaxID=239 RepID=UPI0037BFCC48
MIRCYFVFFCLVFFSFNSLAQKLELDRVTKIELLENQHKHDTSASAAFIFKKAKTDFKYSEDKGFTSSTTFQVKLKIYKKEGLKWANFSIPYYIGYETLEDEYVSIKSGYTYNLENDKVIKTKVSAEGKFKENVNEYWEVKSVTFPNVKVGSIIELEYTLESQNISTLPDFQYQYNIPLDFAEYKSFIPEFYIYKSIRKGYVELSLDQKIETTSQSFEGKVGFTSQSKNLSYRQIISNYMASNVPALKEEDYVNNINNYYGKLEQELQVIRYPEQEPKQIATTWEAVAKSIYEDKDFNAAISNFEYYKNEILSIKNNSLSQEELAKSIFNFVKNRMNWNEKYGYYPRRKVEIAYSEKVGNIAEINLMLVSMLRMVGIDANPVLLSTRENGIAYFPNKTLFNYVIASAIINNTTLLMDATDKMSDINRLPIRTLNGQGRLIKKDGTTLEIDLMPKTNSKDIVNIMATIKETGEVYGKVREQYFDYNAYVFRDKYNGIATQSYIEKLEKEYQGVEISSYNVQNSIDLELPIIENYDFKVTNSVEIIGNKMYFSPFLFFEKTDNPFKQEAREYPIDFVFPNQDKFNVTLTLPNGYIVETLPQAKAIALPDNLGNFKYNISNNGNQIQLLYTHDINQAIIDADYYEVLKNFYKEIIIKQNEKIVLKKE